MTKFHRRLTILLAAFLNIAAFSIIAQPPRKDFSRAQTYDVQHYTIRASFDKARKRVEGDTTVSLKPLRAGTTQVELDAVDLSFRSVTLEPSGTSVRFSTSRGKVAVTLDRAYGPEDILALRFKYSAQPSKGVYFVPASSRSDGSARSAQIWTQGEPEEARHWFPAFDFPSDKATTEQILTVDRNETVIGNGELLSKTENPDGRVTWHFRMPVPHPTYLVSFVIGEYVKIEDRYRDIPLGYYTYPGRENTVRNAYSETKRMFEAFEELTGIPYQFNKYDQTIVANFQFGGMENITATTMADTEIFFADMEFGKGLVSDLVAHELAHSWFGNLVTCRNWAELWLNEGFATFMEAAFRERVNGRGDYLRKIRADAAAFLVDDTINRRRHGLFNQRAGDVNSLFDNPATTYNKGGVVVHMLREQVGSGPFWKGVNIYLNRHKFDSVESTDLLRAMEEASGEDLGWFFDQWVYGAGAPAITVRPTYNTRTKKLALTLSQTQAADAITPSIFRLPLDLTIKAPGHESDHEIEMTRRVQTFTFSVPSRPTAVEIDPEERIPLKKLKVRPLTITR